MTVGQHILLDLHGAIMPTADWSRRVLLMAAEASRATVLHSHFHTFPNGGVSGVLMLAESHISIHTWPERGFAAVDVFMCGKCDPWPAVDVIRLGFMPDDVRRRQHARGDAAITHSGD
jgi:S-adenosylmethionine decarboxylase